MNREMERLQMEIERLNAEAERARNRLNLLKFIRSERTKIQRGLFTAFQESL